MEDLLILFVSGATMLGIFGAALRALIVVASIIISIVLLCIIIKEKNELNANTIDENKIKKAVNLSIWTLVITIFGCIGVVFAVFPILAYVNSSSNAKTALRTQNIGEAVSKLNFAYVMLIVGNAIIIGSTVLLSIISIIGNVLGL